MPYQLLEKVDDALDQHARELPSNSVTFQSIIREDTFGEIASYARSEGFCQLASLLEAAEYASFQHAT